MTLPSCNLYLICLGLFAFLLAGCETLPRESSLFPTSAKIEAIKEERLPTQKKEVQLAGLQPGSPVYIRVFKKEHELEVWMKNKGETFHRLYKTYPICTYSGSLGPKLKEGDEQAPEGFYSVTADRLNPWSKYHLSFNIGYPNNFDRARGLNGSALMIHGGCKSSGCYAMGDRNIEEIYMLTEAALLNGQKEVPVHIFPFRMTEDNMTAYASEKWFPFWKHIKRGYDAFERTYNPPIVVADNAYYRVYLQ